MILMIGERDRQSHINWIANNIDIKKQNVSFNHRMRNAYQPQHT